MFHVSTHLIFTTTQGGIEYYYFHFTDERTKAQGGWKLAQGHTSSQWWLQEEIIQVVYVERIEF